ncbi:hypothetical protein ACQ3I4_03400 [Zafaria sp. Z1313]|nr:hypothetical protein [Zafaria sp. J156]
MSRNPSAPVPAPQRADRPWQAAAVGLIVLLEALGMIAVGVVFAAQLAAPGPLAPAGRVFLLVLILGAAAWQGWVALNVFRGRSWTRAAALVWQVFQVILAVPLVGGETLWLGVLLLVPAAAALLLLFNTKTLSFYEARSA